MKRVVIVPSRDISVVIIRDMDTLIDEMQKNPDIEIIRLHYKRGDVLIEEMDIQHMKEMYKRTGYDYTAI